MAQRSAYLASARATGDYGDRMGMVQAEPFDSVLELIGHTPMVRLQRLTPPGCAEILAKLEFYNPSGSVKDRIALEMVEAAEREGQLKPGFTVVEPTSGNTGTSLALVCALKGYRMVAVMPRQMSQERQDMMKAFGAELVLVQADENAAPGTFTLEDLELTLQTAQKLAEQPAHFMLNQFANPANVIAHQQTTAEEIWAQTRGRLDAVVAAVGTSGTAVGLARRLKEYDPRVKVHVVEPAGSPVISGGPPGYHRIQGIGEGFIPELFQRELFDGVIQVTDEQAKATACRLARLEGLFSGYSAGANVFASLQVARELGPGARVVTLIPDSGMKYLSTELYHRHSEVCQIHCCTLIEAERSPDCMSGERLRCCALNPCP